MTLVFDQVLSSELSRNPLSVFSAAEKAPIRVTRRDGQDLVLMTEREAENQAELRDIAAQFLGIAVATEGTLVERVADRYNWMYALDPVDRAQCADDLFSAARATLTTGKPQLIAAALNSWRDTAIAVADGMLPLGDADVVAQPIPVSRP